MMDNAPPFQNCKFKLCDLPGQCRGEGKCHHPQSHDKNEVTMPTDEYEAMKIQSAIGKLVLEKFVSGNTVPVSRCYINASEIEAIAKEQAIKCLTK
jgi:hypothetical protein